MRDRSRLACLSMILLGVQHATVFAQQTLDSGSATAAIGTPDGADAGDPASTASATTSGSDTPPLDVIPLPEKADAAVAGARDGRPQNRLVEEIVVTSRKREEKLLEVPISIVAFSADKLDAAGVVNAQELGKITPGLVFNRVIGFNTVFLRGIGSDAYLPSADPSVPIYVDDINSLPSQGSIDSLGNIERIEVLKGPQGTLFGRNALGGAIRIVTPDPKDDVFSGEVKLDTGRYNRADAQTFNSSLFLNVPIAEGLAATLSGTYRDDEPFYVNDLGPTVSSESLKGGRVKLKWTAAENLAFTLAGSYEDASTSGGLTGEGTDPSAVLCAICVPDAAFDYHTQHNVPALLKSTRSLVSGQVKWNFSLFDTIVLVSDQVLKVPEGFGELDFTSSPLLSGEVGRQFGKQKTAELRFESNDNSPGSDRFSWVAGTYYLKSEGGYDPLLIQIGTGTLSGLPSVKNLLKTALPDLAARLDTVDLAFLTSGILKTESISGFAEGTYTFIDRLSLTLGLRYDSESRSLAGSKVDVQVAGADQYSNLFNFDVPKVTTNRTSPRVALKWQFDNAQIYTSYSIGYLSPTYNTVNIFKAPDFVKQEEDQAYELGFKGAFFSGLVQLEAAAFHIERDKIITAFTALTSGGAVSFFNGGNGEVNGLELSVQAQPMPDLDPGLSLIASGSYLDAKYKNFPNGRGYDDESGLAFGPDSLFGLPARDFTGNRIVNTPKFSGSTTVAQTLSLPRQIGEVELAVDTYYNSGYFFSAQNTSKLEQHQYQTYGGRLTYFYDPWGLQLTAYAQNFTDERYFASAVEIDFGPGRSLAAPRQFGLRVQVKF